MSNANVTVLTDENGVLREYREVKRKANVGERIKIVSAACAGELYQNNDVLTVTKVYDSGHVYANTSDGRNAGVFYREYTALEPTDIVIIDGVRYREERRKARVGDLIYYPEDQRFAVVIADEDDLANGDCTYYSTAMKYPHIVLTPIDAPQAPTAVAPQVINVNLTITVQPSTDVAQAVADAVKRELTKMSAQEFVSHAEELLGLTKSPQQLRDEIVERAKRDVAELAKPHWNGSGDLVYAIYPFLYTAEFVVNRDKRTVVCLLRQYSRRNGYPVERRGIAKCAPGDVFNSHIGRAIALRRALGLPVPDEYLNAPQPTEVRVGDRISVTSTFKEGEYTVYAVSPTHRTYGEGAGHKFNSYPDNLTFIDEDDYEYCVRISDCKIIDDSREETEVFA